MTERAFPKIRLKLALGLAIVLAVLAVSLAAGWLAPFDPDEQSLRLALRPPIWSGARAVAGHVLGTDQLGRDILSRILYGARVSVVIAAAVMLASGLIGVLLGTISGFFGGWVDYTLQKLVEVVWAFPPLLLAIAILAFLGQGLPILILALVSQRWIPYCRVARAQALSLRSRDFVVAAQAIGATPWRVISRHVIPNLLQGALVIGTFTMATAILSEASLSFLGLGVPPEIPSWGGMLADGRAYISTAWWLALFPGLAIFATVFGINLLGDGLRDLLDPRR